MPNKKSAQMQGREPNRPSGERPIGQPERPQGQSYPRGGQGSGRNRGLKPEELERQERLRTVPTDGPGFINPYNFVSFGPQDQPPVRLERISHEKFSGLSGEIICELTNLTPLCIPDPEATKEIRVQTDQGPKSVKKNLSCVSTESLHYRAVHSKGCCGMLLRP